MTHIENKFESCGIGRDTVRRWARELASAERESQVAFERVRPLLVYLQDALGVHPTTVLSQWYRRYESGELNHISPRIYHCALELKHKAVKTLASGS